MSRSQRHWPMRPPGSWHEQIMEPEEGSDLFALCFLCFQKRLRIIISFLKSISEEPFARWTVHEGDDQMAASYWPQYS